jgi:aryl carrier-like protein|tara:strand:+ start:1531 stop:1887 length:357 start_codon:yes stop_codon:yes gene_type:complete
MKIIIKKILKEVTNLDQNGNDIAVSLSHKAMNHLTDALRAIESALQYADDKDLIEGLESIRMSLLSGAGRQEGFAAEHDGEYDNIINVLGDLIADNSQDNYNFNLNGPGPKAPEGNFQ